MQSTKNYDYLNLVQLFVINTHPETFEEHIINRHEPFRFLFMYCIHRKTQLYLKSYVMRLSASTFTKSMGQVH
jgi:hypothetical protein